MSDRPDIGFDPDEIRDYMQNCVRPTVKRFVHRVGTEWKVKGQTYINKDGCPIIPQYERGD